MCWRDGLCKLRLRDEDTFLDLESARHDFLALMAALQAEELKAVPGLPKALEGFGVFHHSAFFNLIATATPDTAPL